MFDVKGSKELQEAFKQMGEKIFPYMTDAVNNAGEEVKRNVETKAPGKLKNGIELKKATQEKYGVFCTVRLKKGFAYGVPVELGHNLVAWGHPTDAYIKPQPFMRPGADESEDGVEKAISDGLDKVLNEFGG